jgi:zinc transport system ATP-binding protein
MDEPTVGVDAKSARQIMDIISSLNKQGMTIIMTNHDTPELVRVSNKLLIFCEHGNGEFVNRANLSMQQINDIFAGRRTHHHA